MKIVFFTKHFYPHIGGVEKHVLEVSNYLSSIGHDVIIISELSKNTVIGDKYLKSLNKDVQVYRIPVSTEEKRNKWIIWRWLIKNKAIFADSDVIHCHDVFYWYLPFKLLFFNKKAYVTFHGYEAKFPIPYKNIFLRKVWEKLSDGNICIGDYLTKWYGTNTKTILYGASSIDKSIGVLKKKDSLFKIAFIGRVESDNGITVYSKALESLRKEKFKFSFLAAGGGSMKKNFNKFGEVRQIFDIKKVIVGSDIIFASSYLSIIDALSQKKLVICISNNPLKYDYLSMAPFSNWIVIVNNEREVVSAINTYFKEPSIFNKRILDAYKWSKNQTWQMVSQQYIKLWRNSL